MKRNLIVIPLLMALSFAVYHLYFREREPSSFLLITIDTLRADHVGAYGYPRKITPVLDKLAREGVLFENAFCTMPTTIPSHGSIFFSTWPRVHGSTSNFVHFSDSGLTFLPDLLKKAGYSVGAVVSAPHLGKNFQKFDSFHEIDFPERDRKADATLRIATEWLQRNKGRKFFLWIHLWDPHSPYDPHPQFLQKVRRNALPDFDQHYAFLKGFSYTPEQVQAMVDLYDNEIAYADNRLGKFLDDFQKTDPAEFTTIFVTSDHGETLGELAGTEDYAFDHGEFLYDHQLHVPLIISGSKVSEQGKRIATGVSLMDVMPTILQWAGVPPPASVQGASLSSLMRPEGAVRRESIVFLQRREFLKPPMPYLAQRQFGIRERNYKLLYNETDKLALLYKNGEEGRDLSNEQERLKEMMLRRMEQWLALTGKLSKGQGAAVSEEEAEKLRSLGYVQ